MALNSLRTQLFGWLLVPLALFVVFNGWFSYHIAAETATAVQDRMLLGAARIIGEQISYQDGLLQVDIPPAALELFESGHQDRVYYRVAAPHGRLLSGYADLPAAGHTVPAEEWVYFDGTFRDESVRIVAFAQPIFTAPAAEPVLIEVAQTLRAHKSLVAQILGHAMRQQLLMLALAVLMGWIGLRRGLAPLLRLRDIVQRRKPGALEPLDAAPVPAELTPLVHTINEYVRRIDEHMSAHSRFIANASHQLRTPLTLINTQVNYALRSTDPVDKDDALRAIHKGMRQGIRVANQLLVLSTAEAGIGHPLRQCDVDLVEVVQHVLEDLAAFAQARNIDLGFERHGGRAVVRATPAMLHELVANLVDNALRYTSAGGMVTAVVATDEDAVVLRVEDNGPGVPVDERERVFERFYRLGEDKSDGCGLGLPIVREIAMMSEAQVTLSAPPTGTGLVVTVKFPMRPESLPTSSAGTPDRDMESYP